MDNPSAFPEFQYLSSGNYVVVEGMRLKDWFAGQALMGILAKGHGGMTYDAISAQCERHADSMLKERSREDGSS